MRFLDYLRTPESPIDDAIAPDTLALLGHSFGGAAGLYALQGSSDIPNSPFGEFARPKELAGGIFFGTDLRPSLGNEQPSPPVPLINNNDLPTDLILGSNDGISDRLPRSTHMRSPKGFPNGLGIRDRNPLGRRKELIMHGIL